MTGQSEQKGEVFNGHLVVEVGQSPAVSIETASIGDSTQNHMLGRRGSDSDSKCTFALLRSTPAFIPQINSQLRKTTFHTSALLLSPADPVDGLVGAVAAAVLPALAVVVVDHHEGRGEAHPVPLEIAGAALASRGTARAKAGVAAGLILTDGGVGNGSGSRGGHSGGSQALFKCQSLSPLLKASSITSWSAK